ncbi:MAG: HAMP domain-containing histidine kinase [Candidatus Hydrogenedentes bacterium]|nr:HAMP domain-containing histidine kinase [Candidatus Hydrogenedentota bacterium]
MFHWATEYAAQIAENCTQALFVTDGEFRVVHANEQAAALLGTTAADQLIDLHLGEAGGESEIQFSPGFIGGDRGSAQNGRYQLVTSFRDGNLRIDAKFVQTKTDPLSCLVLLTAVPDVAILDQQFFQSEKLAAMDNVVAGVAHELNNPMTAILGYSELLLATETNPKRKQRIALIAEEADRCGKIIANMLTFTRSFGNKLELADVGTLLEEMVSLHAYQMRIDGISVHTALSDQIPQCSVQPSAIRRLFLNIVHNAHQALLEVPEGQREFWASARFEDGMIRIEIADSGPGIAEEVRYKIFDPFFTTRPFGEGMGLGLSVAYGIVHEHCGKIWMDPQEGGGTAIKIDLPLEK